MTSLLGPDAELRWANWLKLLQIPQSFILYRSPKIVTKFTRDHFFGPFDIDYYTGYIESVVKLSFSEAVISTLLIVVPTSEYNKTVPIIVGISIIRCLKKSIFIMTLSLVLGS